MKCITFDVMVYYLQFFFERIHTLLRECFCSSNLPLDTKLDASVHSVLFQRITDSKPNITNFQPCWTDQIYWEFCHELLLYQELINATFWYCLQYAYHITCKLNFIYQNWIGDIYIFKLYFMSTFTIKARKKYWSIKTHYIYIQYIQ